MSKAILTKIMCIVLALCFMFVGCSDKSVYGENSNGAVTGDSLFGRMTNAMSARQNEFYSMDLNRLSADIGFELELGEAFPGFVAELSETPIAESLISQFGVESVGFDIELNRNEDVVSAYIGGLVNDSTIVDLFEIDDRKNEYIYFAIPAIAEGFVRTHSENGIDIDFMSFFEKALNEDFENNKELNSLPSYDELVMFISDYLNHGISVFDDPEVGRKDISIDHVSQNVQYKKYIINGEDALDFVKAVLTKLLNDDEFRDMFIESYPVFAELYENEIDSYNYDFEAESLTAEEVYDEIFIPSVVELLEELEDEDVVSQQDKEEYVSLELYYADDDFLGFTMYAPDMTVNSYSLVNNDDSAFVFGMVEDGNEEYFKLIGKTENNNYNGRFVVKTEDAEGVSIGIENLDIAKLENGIFCGAIVLDESLFEDLYEGLKVKIAFDTDNYFYGNTSIYLEQNSALVAKLYINYSVSDDAENIIIPENYIDENDDAADEWIENVQNNGVSVILKNLSDAGVSSSLLSLFLM